MRLINTRTLALAEFVGKKPPYAILSHTWGSEEVTYEGFHHDDFRKRQRGFTKIENACAQARKDGLSYLWVDTCCIKKSSSAELQEAINSMFKWYERAEVCYAFLDDYPHSDDPRQDPTGNDITQGLTSTPTSVPAVNRNYRIAKSSIGQSRWFTRGWTLQELIAPRTVEFYDKAWSRAGNKNDLTSLIKSITGIDGYVLRGGHLKDISIGRRMSWAADRKTTRPEDLAYSLLGIFDVHMPLLYGEGSRAFVRLQEEILRQSNDQTIFAWRAYTTPISQNNPSMRGLLASSPDEFANFRGTDYYDFRGVPNRERCPSDNILPITGVEQLEKPITITNRGFRITGHIYDKRPRVPMRSIILSLNCSFGGDPGRIVGLHLERTDGNRWARVKPNELFNTSTGVKATEQILYGLRTADEIPRHDFVGFPGTLSVGPAEQIDFQVMERQMILESRERELISNGCNVPHVLYLPRTWTATNHGDFYVQGIHILDNTEYPRPPTCYNITQDRSYLLVKVSAASRLGILMRAKSGGDCIFVIVGITEGYMWSDCTCSCWVDIKHISQSMLLSKPKLLRKLIKHAKKPTNAVAGRTLKFKSGSDCLAFDCSLTRGDIGIFKAWVMVLQGPNAVYKEGSVRYKE